MREPGRRPPLKTWRVLFREGWRNLPRDKSGIKVPRSRVTPVSSKGLHAIPHLFHTSRKIGERSEPGVWG